MNAVGDRAEAEAAFRLAICLEPDRAEPYCNLGHALRFQARFAESLTAYQRGHELGSKQPGWKYPSERWAGEAQQLIALDTVLAAIDQGAPVNLTAGHCIPLAQFCQLYKKRFVAAKGFYERAFAAEPKLADDLNKGHRYDAASAAALAGCGQGSDTARLAEGERARLRQQARLRRQALAWLRADLEAWGKLLEKEADKARPVVLQQMKHWLADPDFAAVRGEQALARLPEAERLAWQKLWAGVADTLARAQGKTAENNKTDRK
jgi:hypothetical protein